MSEKNVILLFSALLAGACTFPEGSTDTGAAASLPASTIEAPGVEPISHHPHCVDHCTCCHESSLGRKYDAPNEARRHFCFARCIDKNDMRGPCA
jgi:hypothetical protein